jgi:microcin C transport system ATP-binding protein
MLLDITNLNLWFGSDTSTGDRSRTQVLRDVSLQIKKHQIVALVGESGSGKSVTALSVLRLLDESSEVYTKGAIRFDGLDILALSRDEIRSIRGNRIAMIFQEPMTSLNPVYSVGNQMVEPLMLHQSMTRHEAEKEAIRLLDRTGIEEPAARLQVFPHQLSGGQRQRVMIAMALACKPKLLIADEPTTALDVTIQAQILGLMQDLREEFGMSVMLITHDLTLVRKVAEDVYIMKDGCIVESGKTKTILNNPQEKYTQHLISSIPDSSPETKESSQILLQTKNLNCVFHLNTGWVHPFKRKKKIIAAVDNVSFSLQQGTTCGIVGESGSGKTTLAMAILKLIRSKGVISFDDIDLQHLSNREMRSLRSEIQIVFQDPYSSLSPRLSIYQIIEEGLKIHFPELNSNQRNEKVFEGLREVGLEPEMAWRYPHEFSGGQRQRIAIARVIVLKPKLLILDEPTSALDVTIQAQIIQLLQDLQARYNMSYLFISHDLRVIRAISDYIAVMQHGRIVEAGPAREIFAAPEREYTKTLFAAAL